MSNLLINKDTILNFMMLDAPWANSHGAYDDYLGMGMIYYTIVYLQKAKTAVCLGSGGGFVPRLMRQAQRDLGIADHTKTILVDANLPKAGWSAPLWLDENSFFRQNFADIEIIIKTTKWAAENYFAPSGVLIDYLHIDANHFFNACLEDFQSYRPFLRKGSIITLHDTNFPGSGVKGIVNYIRMRNDCEFIDFPEIGAGTAIVRITRNPEEFILKHLITQDKSDAVLLERKPNIPVFDPPTTTWKYLESEAFSTRSVLAAHFVKDCPTVIEIGNARTPIDRFLTGKHKSVIVIDPFIHEAEWDNLNNVPCQILHIRACFQDLVWTVNHPHCYGIVILGMELHGLSNSDYQSLFRLIEKARITVIDFSTSWGPSVEQYKLIRNNTKTRIRFISKLDLAGNDVGNLEYSWLPRFDREIHVLEPV